MRNACTVGFIIDFSEIREINPISYKCNVGQLVIMYKTPLRAVEYWSIDVSYKIFIYSGCADDLAKKHKGLFSE